MNRKRLEDIKTITILILVFASLIQVGILWEIQNHWFPISFLSPVFNGASKPKPEDVARIDYFNPERIIIAEGIESNFWAVDNESGDYIRLWNEAKAYLKNISERRGLIGQPQIIAADRNALAEKWSALMEKTGIIFEFDYTLESDLLMWFLGRETEDVTEPVGMKRMMIALRDDINSPVNTIYIQTDDTITRYNINIDEKQLPKEYFFNLIDKIDSSGIYKRYKSVAWMNYNKYFNKDMIISFGGKKSSIRNFKRVSSFVPKLITAKKTEDIAAILLGGEKASYDYAEAFGNLLEFKNLNNLYRLRMDGFLEYKYLPLVNESNKGTASEAFQRAIEFIERVKPLVSGTTLNLSGINKNVNGESYEFLFDYSVNGLKVYYNYEPGSNNRKKNNNALVIRANGNRVTYCSWLLRQFDSTEEESFLTYQEDILDRLINKYNQISDSMLIKSIDISYMLKNGSPEMELIWLINSTEGEKYILEMEGVK
ncbi:MAG: hypothetical protein N2489_09800 [Clostridia bacterium]|nr:hypothetical protein [Clostridia bacterium]